MITILLHMAEFMSFQVMCSNKLKALKYEAINWVFFINL